ADATAADMKDPANWPSDPRYGYQTGDPGERYSGQWPFYSFIPDRSPGAPPVRKGETAAGMSIDLAWRHTIGDDRVVISSGNAILVDKGEAPNRNDLPEFATVVGDDASGADPSLTQSVTLKGLTIDNPQDVDWFRFTLDSDAPDGAQILLSSASNLDGLSLELFEVAGDGSTTPVGEFAVQVSQDATEAGGGHSTLATAYKFEDENAVQNLFRIRGLTIHQGPVGDDHGDVDYFSFTLTEEGGEDDKVGLLKAQQSDLLKLEILDKDGEVIDDEQ
ncbi:MAG: hypothetical protein AAB131_07175, partial [Actinomycetota bacterium]